MKEEIRFRLCGRVTQVKPVKGVNGRVFTRVYLQCGGAGREVASVAAVEFHGEAEQQELKQVRVNDRVLELLVPARAGNRSATVDAAERLIAQARALVELLGNRVKRN